ncbi:hypothetical protein J5T17_002564 [Escherichia fergusonii]|nr:hypothetical protein [Escherichia fergusonii]
MFDIPNITTQMASFILDESKTTSESAKSPPSSDSVESVFDPVAKPEQTLKNMSSLLLTKGTHPDDIVARSHLDHTLAGRAIYQICLDHYKSKGVLPEIQISLSNYNAEAIDTERAKQLAADKTKYALRVQEIVSERKSALLERFLDDNPGKKESDFSLSQTDRDRIETVTPTDVVESYRTEFRLGRQGAERSQTHPGRTHSDGGRMATYRYEQREDGTFVHIPLDDNPYERSEDGTFVHKGSPSMSYEWDRPAPEYAKSAILYDVKLPDGDTCTVFLDMPALDKNLTSLMQPDSSKPQSMSEVSVGIDALKFHPDPPGHTMLHAFNTTYADITLHADKLKEAGISHVLTSPPLTWRADGPSTPSDKKGMWYHAYQPEDLRFIENPHGNLQSYFEMITVLKARGIDVIADIPLNFMGIGGEGGAGGDDHRGTLLYPSKDIREERTASIRRGSGRVEGQTLVHTLKGTIPGTTTQGPIQQYPDMPFTSLHDFEQSRSDASDWNTLKNIRHNRLDGMPKVSAKSKWILDAQRDYLQSLKGLGVKGFRIDAEKHMTSKQLAHVLPHDITKDMLVFGETITPGGEDPAWRDYLRPRLQMRSDIGAYDFPLQDKLISAFKWGGSLQDLRMTEEHMPTSIPSSQSVTFSVNHDIPNNGHTFGHMLFGHPDDEKLANAYILSIPGRMPLIFSDGKAQTSVTEVHREYSPSLGGNAWNVTTGLQSLSSMIEFHNKLHNLSGVWFAYEGSLASPTCLAFSRGDGPVGENRSGHFALVVINKAAREISSVSWPNPLKPGRYKDYGPGDKGEFIVNAQGEFEPKLEIDKRTALMLAWQEA